MQIMIDFPPKITKKNYKNHIYIFLLQVTAYFFLKDLRFEKFSKKINNRYLKLSAL